eukprot:jgi/Tetstr1/425003/TSEL_015471.t1
MEINRPEEQQKAAVGAALDALRGRKTQLPKIRSAIIAEQIAGTRLPPAARPMLTYGQRPPRREEQAPHETTTTANKNINRPEEHHAAEVGATIDAPRSGRAEPPKTPKIATTHHPAPHTTDQSGMHHGQHPQELQPPPTTQLQVAHDPAAAAPQATEMDSDNSPPAVAQPATSVDPDPHPEPAPPAAAQPSTATRETLEATNPSSIPPHPAHMASRLA